MTNAIEFYAWTNLAGRWLMFAGAIAFVVGLTLEKLARRYDWPTVQRCLPALVIAVLLAVLFAANHRTPYPTTIAPRVMVVRGVAYMPYCEGYFYYLDMLCWIFD